MSNYIDIAGTRQETGACLDQYIASFEERLTARNYKAGTIKIANSPVIAIVEGYATATT
jgi:hypothetical protein